MKKLLTGPRLILSLMAAAIMTAIILLLHEPAIRVDFATASRGPLTVRVSDLGETRVVDLFIVSAPVTGRLTRVPLKPGDPIIAKAAIGTIQPLDPGPLDARTVAQIEANILTLGAQAAAVRARYEETRAEETAAEADYKRTLVLALRGFASQAALDRTRAARDRSRAATAESRAALTAAHRAVEQARAALTTVDSGSRGAAPVLSPISGYILRVPQESERVVTAGTALVEIGDPDRLEAVVDLLSEDAVRVRPGSLANIEDWGGETPLRARVRRVEPFGFTKLSALGVEEQRVNVILDIIEPRPKWARLGHGYRVTVAIAVWHGADVLRVPVGALFRDRGDWAVFVVDAAGRARLRRVAVGHINDEAAEIRAGLGPGARVISHPTDRVRDGVRVSQR